MASVKTVTIANRRFRVRGDPADRYFRDYVQDGEAFKDAPIAVAIHYVEPKSVVVDVGANIGLSTLAFASLAARGRVLSIEPSPANFELLVRNIDDNGLTNVTR